MSDKTFIRYSENVEIGKNLQDRTLLFTISQILEELLAEVKQIKTDNDKLFELIKEKPPTRVRKVVTNTETTKK